MTSGGPGTASLMDMRVTYMKGWRAGLRKVDERMERMGEVGPARDAVKDELRQVDHWLIENDSTPVAG